MKKPSRKDLLHVINKLQGLVGGAKAAHQNDRDPHGYVKAQKLLDEAFELCVEALAHDPPVDWKD